MIFLKLVAVTVICLSLVWAANGPGSKATAGTPNSKARTLRGKDPVTGKPIKRVLVDDEVRLANWCVTGRDEVEMQYFPYSEFQPYLARTASSSVRIRDKYGKVKYDYNLRLDEIKFTLDEAHILKASEGLGRGDPDYTPVGKMHNTAHLKFKAYKLRPYPLGVKLVRVPTLIEGLVIQVNHSPLGIGTATAQFMDPETEVICYDCRHPLGRPVGCRKRTKNDVVHPTIMMYHHQMPILASFKNRTNPKLAEPKKCVLCIVDPGKTAGEFCRCTERSYDSPTSSLKEGDTLCSLKPEAQKMEDIPDCNPACHCYVCLCQEYDKLAGKHCRCEVGQPSSFPVKLGVCPTAPPPVKPCNPNDASEPSPSCSCIGPFRDQPELPCSSFVNRQTPPTLETCRCVDYDPSLPEGTQDCTGAGVLRDCGGPAPGPLQKCRRKIRLIAPDCVLDNTVAGCGQFDEYQDYLRTVGTVDSVGKSDEVHANLQWYFPPCLRSRAVEFAVMVVHSFAKQEFEVIFFGPYELPTLQTYPEQSQHVPSPYFHGYSKLYVCDDPTQVTTIVAFADRSARATYPFGYSYNYDKCIRNLSTEEKDGGQFCLKPEAYRCSEEEERKYSVVVERSCEEACEVTTLPSNTTAPKGKNPHGAINIITNFCIQPIAIFIGRYYKETLNRKSFKGMALWYWAHLIGSGFASIAMYFGYFHPVWLPRWHQHVIAGDTILILLALTYISSWIRHQNKWIKISAEFFHGMCGYICSFMAYWCLHTVKVKLEALILIYTATAFLGVGYLIMEACIFYWDHKFGMHPHRRHLPTVEARFGDLPVPGTQGRIIFLFFMSIVMLILTIIAAFIA